MATLGSTSYDDAPRDPEPEWSGATWYGDSSGTYWTINPKEYADPRKHGPEYLARARRVSGQGMPGSAAGDDPNDAAGPLADEDAPDRRDGPTDPTDGPADPAHSPIDGSRPEATRDGQAAAEVAADSPARHQASRRRRTASWTAGDAGPTRTGTADAGPRVSFEGATGADRDRGGSRAPGDVRPRGGSDSRARSDGHDPDEVADGERDGQRPSILPRRAFLALLAWPPLGFAAGQVVNELTGCGRHAATCSDLASVLGWLAQPAIIGLLLLVPILARPAAVASVAVGIGAIGGAAILSAAGGGRAPSGTASSLLLGLLVAAWVVGLIGALRGIIPLPAWLRDGD